MYFIKLTLVLNFPIFILFVLSFPHCLSEMFPDLDHAPHQETDHIAIKVHDDHHESIHDIAQTHGYENLGQIGDLKGYYLFQHKHDHREKRSLAVESLKGDFRVTWHQPQTSLKRVKRDNLQSVANGASELQLPWKDPLYSRQWYLHQGAVGSYDMRVREAWKQGYTGKGAVISILDDGIQPDHPDLKENYDPLASKDINGRDDDPTPQDNGDNKHGTRCAGEVSAVAGNSWCGVGVAYHSKIGGVRMLDGTVTDSVEAASLSHNPDHISIYSASWGPEDDGKTFDGPGPMAKEAFFNGITKGRQGKGSIFVWASGNGGSHSDSCSCDGYTTSIYTLSVSSATYDNRPPWYLEECPSTLATTYSSAGIGQPAVVTVDFPNTCTEQHTGTSASAPLAAGVVALALEANSNLTWRDMQHLVVRSSDPTPLLGVPGWTVNGVGRKVSNKFGYGLMNAGAMTKLAKDWKTVPAQHVCTYNYHMDPPNPRPLTGKFSLNYTMAVPGCDGVHTVKFVEQIHAVLTIQFSRRGDLKITLISPSGTRSVLLPPRPQDINRSGFHQWPFLSVQQWGEDPRGLWTLIIENVGHAENTGTFHDWSLTFYGTAEPPQDDLIEVHHKSTPLNSKENASSNELPGDAKTDIQQQVQRPREALSEQEPTEEGASSSDAAYSVADGGAYTSTGGGRGILTAGCHEECDQQAGCTEKNLSSACMACKNFKLNKRNRGGFKCVSKCGDGYYTDLPSKTCRDCPTGCGNCSSNIECDTCEPALFLVQADPGHLHHGRCVDSCPTGFIITQDLTSKDGYGICSWDPKYQYTNVKPFVVDETATSAVPAPPVCTDTDCKSLACQNGQYCNNAVPPRCCQCHQNCEQCNGPLPTNCTSCTPGTYQRQGSCVTDCETNEFNDYKNCLPCHVTCESCDASGPDRCTKCTTGYTMNGKLCTRVVALPRWSTFTLLSVGVCVGAVALFGLIFACLMWRDRHYHKHAKIFAYAPLSTKSGLGIHKGLGLGASLIEDDGLGSLDSSGDEDNVFDAPELIIKR